MAGRHTWHLVIRLTVIQCVATEGVMSDMGEGSGGAEERRSGGVEGAEEAEERRRRREARQNVTTCLAVTPSVDLASSSALGDGSVSRSAGSAGWVRKKEEKRRKTKQKKLRNTGRARFLHK